MRIPLQRSLTVRALGAVVVGVTGLALVCLATPAAAQAPAQKAETAGKDEKPAAKELKPASPVKVNRVVPKVERVADYPKFPDQPSEQDIFRARVFAEPLVPVGGAVTFEENRALADAITSYLKGGDTEDTSSIEKFLAEHPQSAWRASLRMNLGVVYRQACHFTKALACWDEAWRLAKDLDDTSARAVADRSAGEMMLLHTIIASRLEPLEALDKEIGDRDVRGSAGEWVQMGREGLLALKTAPQDSTPSAMMSLDRILAYGNANYKRPETLNSFLADLDGATIGEAERLAESVGMKLRMAFRGEAGAEVPVPAVFHWKLGHFSALLKLNKATKRYLVHDSAVGGEAWVSQAVIDEEGSGYLLIRTGPLPAGWREVTPDEVAMVRGW